MASFPCAPGCGFISERCDMLFLSGRHLNIFLLSLCWLLIMWMQGLLCFLLKACAWDYFIITELESSMNIKQRAVSSFACHLSPSESGRIFFFISTSSSIWCFITWSVSFLPSFPPLFFIWHVSFPTSEPQLISSRKVLELARFLYSKDPKKRLLLLYCCPVLSFLKAVWSDISFLMFYKAILNFLAKHCIHEKFDHEFPPSFAFHSNNL